MIILTIRTDKPEAEIGIYKDSEKLVYKTWQAHRELSSTLHTNVEKMLNTSDLTWNDIRGIVYYGGPGSFTGLRIGAAFANSLKYANNASLVQESGDGWVENGIEKLLQGQNEAALPNYGAEARTTQPKK